jgi:predicted enzyme related to lactoylglutathione lyase
MIKDIAFVAYPCANVAETREWYEKHLGLTFTGSYAEEGVELYNEANVASACFALMHQKWMERDAGTGVGCTFEVDNLDDAIAKLRASGVSVGDAYPTPVCKVTSLSDPEGNKVSLHQRTAPYTK